MASSEKPIQFGIRHLLAAMFAVALLAALIAPWVRGWGAQQWLNLGIQAAVVAATFGLYIGGNHWTRQAARRQMGQVHFRIGARTWGQRAWRPGNAYVTLAFATFMLFLYAAVTITSGARDTGPFMQGIYAGLFAAMGVTQLCYPPDEMLLGERGMAMSGWQFIPWERAAFAHQPDHPTAPIFVKTTGWAFELLVSPELEQPVADFLRDRVKPWPHPPQRRRR